jgi:hypothetical protein
VKSFGGQNRAKNQKSIDPLQEKGYVKMLALWSLQAKILAGRCQILT